MAPNRNRWTTNPEYIQLLNYLIEKTEIVRSPMSLRSLAKEYKEKMGVTQTATGLFTRISRAREIVPHFQHIGMDTKVKMMFALSIPVNADFLKTLKDAVVEVDDKNQITFYKANDGRLELKGDHSLSAKQRTANLESKRCHLKLIRNYFEAKDNADGIAMNEDEREMRYLIKFITKKCDNIISPLNVKQLSKDFNRRFGVSRHINTIRQRINNYCREIQSLGHLNTQTKVKQLFGLSASVNLDCLEELRKEAVVEVDDSSRIKKYTANDNSLILQGTHSSAAKKKFGWIRRQKDNNATKNSCDSDGEEGEESEEQNDYSDEDSDKYSSEFDSDNENHLDETEDHKKPSIQADDIDYETPVRRRSASKRTADDDYEYVPQTRISHNKNRENVIEKGRSAKTRKSSEGEAMVQNKNSKKAGFPGREINKRVLTNSEQDDEDISMDDEPEDSNEDDLGSNKVTTRSGRVSKKRVLDVDGSQDQIISAPNFKTPKSVKRKTDKTESSSSKRTRIPPNDSMSPDDLDDYDPNYSVDDLPRAELKPFRESIGDKEDKEVLKEVDANKDIQISERPPREYIIIDEDEDTPQIPNLPINSNGDTPKVELQPFRGRILDNEHLIERDEDIRRIQKPYPDTQVPHDNTQIVEAPIKVEYEVPVKEEYPLEDIKPETDHNSKINFLNTLQTLILFLDNPLLSQIQSKIQQKIQEMEGCEEVIHNNEAILFIELLIARMTNHSSSNLSETTESVSLREFLCHLKAAILNSKMMGLDSLLEVVKKQIKDLASKDKIY